MFKQLFNTKQSNHEPSAIKQPLVSVVMPVYNVEAYLADSIESVLRQSFNDFELIIVDDGSKDSSKSIAQMYAIKDKRITLISQKNRGLAGARNTGIFNAKGKYIAFLDSDDLWHRQKLQQHTELMEKRAGVGVSYSSSEFIDDAGNSIGLCQSPKIANISKSDVLLRNPVGNGSAPVIRKEALNQIAFNDKNGRINYFDESLRQSEDIECWVRIIATTQWEFLGIKKALTYYRVNNVGLSANINAQLESWKLAVRKMSAYAPELINRYGILAKAYQYRYLARRAIRSGDSLNGLKMMSISLITYPSIVILDSKKTIQTIGAAFCLFVFPKTFYAFIERLVIKSSA